MRQLRESCEKLGQGGKAGFKTFLPQPSSFLLVSTLNPNSFQDKPEKISEPFKENTRSIKNQTDLVHLSNPFS